MINVDKFVYGDEDVLEFIVEKHGTGDQTAHGNWARGRVSAKLTQSILDRVKANGGLSVNMKDGSEPTKGYMVASPVKQAPVVDADDFFNPAKGRKILGDFVKANKKDLGGGKKYLGLWHNKEDNKVYLDVSENVQDKSTATRLGRERNQISIWDVVNFEEIGTGGTGVTEKRRDSDGGITIRYIGDDRRTNRFLGGFDLQQTNEVEKHSTHDQSSHAGSRRRIGSDATETEPRKPQGEQEVTDPDAPKPKLKPGRKPDASGSLEERAEKLADGKRIQVTKKEAKKIMKIMAKREDNPDLTNMHIENTQLYDEDNLGIPRNKMPQVPSDTKLVFISEMEKRGARVQRGVADPSKLHPIQEEMSASKVGLIMKSLRKKGMKTGDGGRIIISKDNFVIDGHHRWAAAAMLSFEDSSIKLPVIRVDMNHKDLIAATLAWNDATGIRPIGMGESNKPGQVRKAWAEFDFIIAKAIRGRTIVRFQPGLKPRIEKHLGGGHDQTTHGRWADSGLPHQLANVEESLDFLFDEGLIRPGEIPLKYKYESKYISTGPMTTERTETRLLVDGVRSSIEGGVRMWNLDLLKEKAKEQGISKELENKIDSMLQEKMLSGDKDSIRQSAREQGIKLGLRNRQLEYYSDAIVERATMLATTNNDLVRYEIVKMLVNENLIPKDMSDLSPRFIKQFERTVETMKKSLDKGFPVVAIEADDMLKVIGDGRFKTQHETRESNGAYKPYLRRQRELALAGVPLDTKASERPIYGYVATQERGSTPNTSDYNQDRYNINNHDVAQYGNVRVVLKDDVKQRTSYTIPDSLDGYALARPLTEKHTFKTLSQAGVHHDLSISHGGKEREGYVEAQIHRGVKVSDISKIYVMQEKKGRAETKSIRQIKDALAEKNLTIPVESLEYENA
jgi:hypothetical protein